MIHRNGQKIGKTAPLGEWQQWIFFVCMWSQGEYQKVIAKFPK